jgi:putative membrane protein insertion efficiency factor
MDKLDLNEGSFELNVEEHLRPSLERQLTGSTKSDLYIQSLPLPDRPYMIRFAVMAIRVYRKYRPTSIGNRCVFEPSCSHYSEMAIREYGFIGGIKLTIRRLFRCRPGNGGIDLSCIREEACNTK